jgi:TRAP-type C4-dicarboxylate transport system substrate-binding protein
MRIAFMCCLLLVAGALPTGDLLAEEIKISHQWAEGVDGRDRAARVFVQEAEARAKDLKFRIFPKSSLNIQPPQVLGALRENRLQMAIYPLTYAVGEVPEFSLAGLPGLVPDLDAARALKSSAIHDTLQSIAEASGLRIITWWWSPGGFFAKGRIVSGPKSVKDLKMRAAEPLFERMLQEAGASVINIPSTEAYAGLQSGRLDAILTSYEGFMSLRLFEQAKYATLGSTMFMSLTPLVISLTTWKGLTDEQRTAIGEAADISDAYFEALQRDAERRVVRVLQGTGGTIHRMKKDDFLDWLQLAQKTAWLEYTKTNPRAQELLISTVQRVLEQFGTKDDLIDSVYNDDVKN